MSESDLSPVDVPVMVLTEVSAPSRIELVGGLSGPTGPAGTMTAAVFDTRADLTASGSAGQLSEGALYLVRERPALAIGTAPEWFAEAVMCAPAQSGGLRVAVVAALPVVPDAQTLYGVVGEGGAIVWYWGGAVPVGRVRATADGRARVTADGAVRAVSG